MYFVWKAMQNAKKVIDAKIGEDVVTDMRVLHIHRMVREYALLQSTPDIHMCIMCVKIPKGTKYAF
jgi:hypothetical protein